MSASAHAEAGVSFAGFQMTVLPYARAGAIFPAGRCDREIPRRHDPDEAHWLSPHVDLDTSANGVSILSNLAQCFCSVIGEELTRPENLAPALRPGLALFPREEFAEFIGALHQLCTHLVQQGLSLFQRRRLPAAHGFPTIRHCINEVVSAGLRVESNDVICVGWVRVFNKVIGWPPATADEV